MSNNVNATTAINNNKEEAAATTVKEETGIASPWMTCFRKINAMFEADKEVTVTNPSEFKVVISSANKYKLEAIKKIIRQEIKFGNVTLTIECVDETKNKASELANDFRMAFNGNGFVKSIIEAPYGPDQMSAVYLLMKKQIVQFPNDNACDYNGNSSFLAEDVARELFNTPVLGPLNIGTSKEL